MYIKSITAATCLLLVSSFADAQVRKPTEQGWSGDIMVGVASITVEGHARTLDDYNPSLNSFDEPTKSESMFMPGAAGNAAYTFSDINHQFFAGVSRSKVVDGQFSPELGYRYWRSDDEYLSVALIPVSFAGGAWADPFVLGAPRVETDRSVTAVHATWEHVLGSNFKLEFGRGTVSIDDELSGMGLGLSAPQRSMLDREGDLNYISAGYSFMPLAFLKLEPNLYRYSKDGGGSATDFESTGLEIDLQTGFSQNQFLLMSFEYEQRKTDADNPVFNDRSDSSYYSVFAAYLHKGAFGMKKGILGIMATHSNRDDDIDFFDQKGTVIATGVVWQF